VDATAMHTWLRGWDIHIVSVGLLAVTAAVKVMRNR
jgi:hypothetical protein